MGAADTPGSTKWPERGKNRRRGDLHGCQLPGRFYRGLRDSAASDSLNFADVRLPTAVGSARCTPEGLE